MPAAKEQYYLGRFEGLVDPIIIAGPFEDDIPDDVIIEALKKSDEEDLLFGLTITTENGKPVPKTWSFSGGTMDDLREKAGITYATGKDLLPKK